MFRKLTVAKKLVLTLAGAVAIMALIITVAMVGERAIVDRVEFLVDSRYPGMMAAVEMKSGIDAASRGLNGNLVPEIAAAQDWQPGMDMITQSLEAVEAARAKGSALKHSEEGLEQWNALEAVKSLSVCKSYSP